MAKLRVFSYLKNDVYFLRFENDPEALSEADKQLMRDFGEPEIDLGGTFLDNTANEFDLPHAYVKVRSGFPVLREFDAKAGTFATNTLVKVDGYKSEIVTRFTAALETLRDKMPAREAYVGEEVFNV